MCPKEEPGKGRRRRPLPKLVGRDDDIDMLKGSFNRALKGRGSMVFIEGELGAGKTRLLNEAEKVARENGLRVLWARCIGGVTPLMPFLNALENVDQTTLATGSTIDEIFLLHSDGRLILHETQRLRPDMGDTELKGLLEEIKRTRKAGLRGLFLGNMMIIIEAGAITSLAAVIRGEETSKMRQQMKYLLATLEDRYGETLMDWKGHLADLKGLRDSLKALMLGDYGRPDALRFDFEMTSPTVIEDIAKFLESSSRQMPLALLFDDVHWMDSSSLKLMELLGNRIEEARIVVVGSYRPEEVPGPGKERRSGKTLSGVLKGLGPVKGVTHLRLSSLTRDEIGEMLASVYEEGGISGDLTDFIFRHGEGNPFYTEEIMRALEDSGKLWLSDEGWRTEDLSAMDIPVTIREAVLVRMASLEKMSKEVLQHAAVIGREWDRETLHKVLKDPSDLDQVLGRLENLKLISKVDEGRYRFDHDVVRETAYDDLSEAMRKLYHRKVGEAYEKMEGVEGKDVTEISDDALFRLAEHFSRSKDKDKALRYNLAASRVSRSLHDLRGAEVLLTRALEAARALKKREVLRRVLLDLAGIETVNGEWDNALSYYDEVLGMLHQGEKDLEGRIQVKIGTIEELKNRWNTSMEHLENALEIFQTVDDPAGKALALAEKGRLFRRIGNYDSAMTILNEVLDITEKGKKVPGTSEKVLEEYDQARMKGFKERGGVLFYRGKYEEALKDYEVMIEIAHRLGDEAAEGSAYMNMGLVHVYMGDRPKGIEHYERSIEISKRVGNHRTMAIGTVNLTEALIEEERYDEAAGHIRKALEVFYRLEDRLNIAQTHMVFGVLLTEKEELDEAIVHFNMALEMALDIKETAILAQIYSNYGRLYARRNDHAMARKLFRKSIALHSEGGRHNRAQAVKRELDEVEKKRRGRLREVSVGRKEELIGLIRAFRDADMGVGKVVIIEGATGTGKSKLLDQFLSVTTPHKVLVLTGRCTPSENMVPYAPFIETLRSVFQKEVTTEAIEGVKEVVSDNPSEMLKLFPMLSAIPEIARLAARGKGSVTQLSSIQKEKDRLFENITRLVLSFTRGKTVILILDDFHWADVSSIGLLHYLARNSREASLMIIVTYSPDVLSLDEEAHVLTDTLRLLNRERLIDILKLKNLNERETATMVYMLLDGVTLPEEVTMMVHKETQGNPFFIEEVVLSLIREGIIDPDDKEDPVKGDLSDIKVPRTMTQVVEKRIESLEKEERDILRLAGVIGYKFDFDTLQELSGQQEDRLIGLMDVLMEKGVIMEEEGRDEVFRFPLEHFRRMVTEGLPPSERIKLHDKVARILEKGDSPEDHAFDLALHHRMAGNLLEAARWSFVAGSRAGNMGAAEEAMDQLRTALELLDHLPPSKEVQELKAKVQFTFGDVTYKTGNYEGAAQNFLYLLETAKDLNDDRFLGLAYLGIGKVRSARGAFPQAKESYLKALDIFERIEDMVDIINARRFISVILWREGLFEEAIGELLMCRDLAVKSGNHALLASVHSHLGNVYRDMGEWDKSIDNFKTGIAALEKGGDPYELATAYNNIGATYRYMNEWNKAIDHFDKCITLCKRIKFPSILGYGLKNKGECMAKRGRAEDLDEAEDCCDEAMTIFEELSHRPGVANVHMIRGIIERFRGNWDQATKDFERAIKAGKLAHVPDLLGDVHFEYALTLRKGDDSKGARKHMRKARAIFDKVGASGRIERATEFLEELGEGGGDKA